MTPIGGPIALDVLVGLRVDELDPLDREAFVDHVLVGRTLEEIGSRWEPPVTREAVRLRVERARSRLMLNLAEAA